MAPGPAGLPGPAGVKIPGEIFIKKINIYTGEIPGDILKFKFTPVNTRPGRPGITGYLVRPGILIYRRVKPVIFCDQCRL